MSQFKNTSWGRTHRPKALKRGGAVPSKETASEVTTIAAADLNDDLNDATAGHNGYSTENQRFLHIQIENNGVDDTLKLYAYNYAFGSWSQLYLPHGFPQNDVGDISADDVVTQVAATTNSAWVEAKWTTINGKFMVVVPLHGIDRVAFVHDGTPDAANFKVRAACSTF